LEEFSHSAGSELTTPPRPLLIPVAGVRPEDLVDTYTHARSDGRRHDAIDIAAPRNTPVLAVAEGTVLKLFQSEQGGITLYQLDPDQRTVYYYAHLDRYAPAIAEGMRLWQGDVIGFVGDTGNAGAGDYHLHFEITTTEDPTQYWGGTPTNPYPLLRGLPAPPQQ
jgi:peptidoglycan LD-endopeptidase LytH